MCHVFVMYWYCIVDVLRSSVHVLLHELLSDISKGSVSKWVFRAVDLPPTRCCCCCGCSCGTTTLPHVTLTHENSMAQSTHRVVRHTLPVPNAHQRCNIILKRAPYPDLPICLVEGTRASLSYYTFLLDLSSYTAVARVRSTKFHTRSTPVLLLANCGSTEYAWLIYPFAGHLLYNIRACRVSFSYLPLHQFSPQLAV